VEDTNPGSNHRVFNDCPIQRPIKGLEGMDSGLNGTATRPWANCVGGKGARFQLLFGSDRFCYSCLPERISFHARVGEAVAGRFAVARHREFATGLGHRRVGPETYLAGGSALGRAAVKELKAEPWISQRPDDGKRT
jgi:hypothetical protein